MKRSSFFCLALCLCFICRPQEKVHFNGFVAEFNAPDKLKKARQPKLLSMPCPMAILFHGHEDGKWSLEWIGISTYNTLMLRQII